MTTLTDLKHKITQCEAKLAVIGLGYVGLPVASMLAVVGFDVIGVEIKAERVDKINAGILPMEGHEPGMQELLGQVITSGKLRATTHYDDLTDRDVILIDVETPVDGRNIPQYEALRSSLESLGPVLKPGGLVIVESTIAPGTMEKLARPLLEAGTGRKVNDGFFLGNCPERVMPGKLLANLKNLSRVVGGGTPETAETMVELYKFIVDADLDPVDWITAELVKTTENAYRDTQIAFANEVALICEAVGGDVWKVRELVNKSPYRQMHLPGAGVGGHCIPKDPWLLAYSVDGLDVPLKVIPTSRAVNDGMPLHIADLAQQALAEHGQEIAGSRILVMGYAYLEDSDDARNSPSEILVRRLHELGAEVSIHDPYLAEYQGDLSQCASNSDAVIVMVRHSEYIALDMAAFKDLMHLPVLVDGRGIYNKEQMLRHGYTYRGVGVGQNNRR
jgi:UDP-N-acetyl-D-mannosaminuronic acid dehydrogenase